MLRSTVLASLALLGASAAAPAVAQAPMDAAGYVSPRAGNVVGGGSATITGGGDNLTILYSTGGAGGGGAIRSQVPRLAAVTNGAVGAGSSITIEYLEPERSPAGRHARLVGGGDNAEVVYYEPAQPLR